MPSAASITVKAWDGTTDVVYYLQNPSSGDGVKALWRASAVSAVSVGQPWLTMSSRYNAPRTARRLDFEYRYPQPYTTTTTGLISVANQCIWTASALVPDGCPTAILQEDAAQFANLLASPLVKNCVVSGFAPT